MFGLTPEARFTALLWVLAALVLQALLLILVGVWVQIRWERRHRLRVDCQALWEEGIVAYLYRGNRDLSVFGTLGPRERRLFIPFLLRVLGTLAGREGAAVRALYHRLELFKGLGGRLHSHRPKLRAMAALEVGSFRVEGHFPRMVELLSDSVPHVAHAAARGLAGTGRLDFAEAVLRWALSQDVLQQGRQLEILERFGSDFMRWMESRLDTSERLNLREWIIYAQLAASGRKVVEPSRLIAMLDMGDLEALAAAIRALGSLGMHEALPFVMPFAEHKSWILRAQAAKVIGCLAGAAGVPKLLDLIGDRVFAVRRNAAWGLVQTGSPGITALWELSGDAAANPFARDLARECLQWLEPTGDA